MEPYSKEPVTLIEHIFPGDTNDHDTLFGGRLLSVMDKAGGIACSKFAHREFVTISIDSDLPVYPAVTHEVAKSIASLLLLTSTFTSLPQA